MKCENNCRKTSSHCHCCAEVSPPLECVPCRLCGDRDEMYAEIPVEGDWHGQGFVMRIGCLCPASMELEKDETRTEFEIYEESILQWNEMQEDRG